MSNARATLLRRARGLAQCRLRRIHHKLGERLRPTEAQRAMWTINRDFLSMRRRRTISRLVSDDYSCLLKLWLAQCYLRLRLARWRFISLGATANLRSTEQKRRQAIREGFDRLTELVPGLEGQGRSESIVLNKTVSYMRQQLREREQLVERIEQLGGSVNDGFKK
jgi:heteromeric Ino2p/Ino4p transcription factor